MAVARKQIVNLNTTTYYHCTTRCVRGEYLCGQDRISGKNYLHRRQLIIDRIAFLARYFCIDICAYAVMENHYHLVLRVNRDKAKRLNINQVYDLYTSIYKTSKPLAQAFFDKNASKQLKRMAKATILKWRARLYDMGWFMRSLNEFIAKQANAEDGKKGHFWASRYYSQALLDRSSLLTCMAYVDLNQIRSAQCSSLDSCLFSSIRQRLAQTQQSPESSMHEHRSLPCLLGFENTGSDGIDFSLQSYVNLVEVSGKVVREGKRGYLLDEHQGLLKELQLNEDSWTLLISKFEGMFHHFAGLPKKLNEHAGASGKLFHKGAARLNKVIASSRARDYTRCSTIN